MAKDKYMEQGEGVEVGYFAKRRQQFMSDLEKGVKAGTSSVEKVGNRVKNQRTNSKRDIEGKSAPVDKNKKPEQKKDQNEDA